MRKQTKRNISIFRIERKCDYIIGLLTATGKRTELDSLIEQMRSTAKKLSEQAESELLKGYGK